MEERLKRLYEECINELKSIEIDVLDEKNGIIDIALSKRSKSRYGCCKQEEPDSSSRYYEKIRNKRYIRYGKFKKHRIEISEWVMQLDEKIIKNTIIHEIIHCFPYCNNHGEEFKKYAQYINENLGYNISRVGNKRDDYEKSNIEYKENLKPNYKISCIKCNQVFYRKRIAKNFQNRYRCGICNGKFNVVKLTY